MNDDGSYSLSYFTVCSKNIHIENQAKVFVISHIFFCIEIYLFST